MNRSVKADLTVTNCAYMYTSHPSLLVADVAAIKDRDDGLEFLTGNRPPPDLTGHDGRTFTVNVAAKDINPMSSILIDILADKFPNRTDSITFILPVVAVTVERSFIDRQFKLHLCHKQSLG